MIQQESSDFHENAVGNNVITIVQMMECVELEGLRVEYLSWGKYLSGTLQPPMGVDRHPNDHPTMTIISGFSN